MFIPSSYAEAITCCFITMLCWGSWSNTERLTIEKWRFELFYWDYAIGILLTTVLLGFTWGSVGDVGRPFIADLAQSKPENFFLAFSSGVLFNVANIILAISMTSVGMQLALPLSVAIGLIVGVVSNYVAAPLGHPVLIFVGVTLIVFAIWLDVQADRRIRPAIVLPPSSGLAASVSSGALFGLFYWLLAISTAHHFNQPEMGRMGPYASVFSFALGVFLSAFLFIPSLMEEPIAGPPLTADDYFNGSLRDHLVGVLGGAIWCFGLEFSILAAEHIGFAISFGLAQGAMLVTAIWSIFFWEEFRDAPEGTNILLFSMAAAYILGLGSFMIASLYA